MRELRAKQKKRRVLYSIPSLIFLAFITFLLARGAMRVIEKERESSTRSLELQERVSSLVSREEVIKKALTRLRTEDGIKDEIRERFSVAEEGEHVAIIIDGREMSSSTDESTRPWYKRFWSAIIGKK